MAAASWASSSRGQHCGSSSIAAVLVICQYWKALLWHRVKRLQVRLVCLHLSAANFRNVHLVARNLRMQHQLLYQHSC
jgi:hypothetical protein